jgi:hypothetical protein
MTTTQNDTIEGIQARADHLVETCDGGPTFKAELQELANDVKSALTNDDKATKLEDKLEEVRATMWKADALLGIAERGGFEDDSEMDTLLEVTRPLLSMACQAIDDALELLGPDALGGTALDLTLRTVLSEVRNKEPRNDDAATVADVALDRYQVECNKLSPEEVGLRLRQHCWDVGEMLSAFPEEDGFSVHKTFTRSGLKNFLAELEYLQSLLPAE